MKKKKRKAGITRDVTGGSGSALKTYDVCFQASVGDYDNGQEKSFPKRSAKK